MKRLILCALATAGLCIPALAADPTPEQKAQIEKPITMNNSGNEKKQVVFTHSAHAKTDCAFCHHKAADGNIYVGCAVKGCHDSMDKKDKSEHGSSAGAPPRKATIDEYKQLIMDAWNGVEISY